MKIESNDTLSKSFLHLMIIYAVLIFSVTLGFVSKHMLHFQLFAVIVGVMGFVVLKGSENVKIDNRWILLPLLIATLFRVIPYIGNDIPLGYDPGIYKYVIEKYWMSSNVIPPHLDNWIKTGFPPGLFILTTVLHLYGFDSFTPYVYLFAFFDVLIILGIYMLCKEFFTREVAVLASVIYSVSIVQFRLFQFFYYKNVVAVFLALLALHLLHSKRYIPLIVIASVLGAIHRPTFLLFGITYVFYTALSYVTTERADLLKRVVSGLTILMLSLAFYVPANMQAILQPIKPLLMLKIGGGTFITFSTYEYSSLYYLPMAVIGALVTIKRRNFNPILLWTLLAAAVVCLKLVFFNRFIAHLDLGLVILAGVGCFCMLKHDKGLSLFVITLLVASSFWATFSESKNARPLVDDEELKIITELRNIKEDAYVMAVSSYYSPWLLYSGKKVIAPGLFDYDKWNYTQWRAFWKLGDCEEAARMLKVYDKPIYIYIGKKTQINEAKFKCDHFKRILGRDKIAVYKFIHTASNTPTRKPRQSASSWKFGG